MTESRCALKLSVMTVGADRFMTTHDLLSLFCLVNKARSVTVSD